MRMATILVGITLCLLLLASSAAASEYTLGIFGNANEDDTINMQDVTYTELIILEYRDETELSDAKYDGKINMQDVTQIELVILGREKELTVEDDFGEAVTLRLPIEDFTYHGHNAFVYETLRAIGVADRIVGITDRFVKEGSYQYSEKFFPELIGLTNIGLLKSPDYEVINELKPGAVITDEERYLDREKLPDIPVIALDVKPAQFTENTRKYGYIFGKIEEAGEYISWRNGLEDEIKERTAGLSDDEKPLVYLGYYKPGTTSCAVYGKDHHRSYPVHVAGGANLGDEISGSVSLTVDPEWIIERNPDVVILLISSLQQVGYDVDDPSDLAALREEFMNRPEFAAVNAAQTGDVYVVTFPMMIVGGGSSILASAYYAKWLQPDAFEDMDPQAVHQEYLDRFQTIDFDVKEHGVFVYHPEKHPDGR